MTNYPKISPEVAERLNRRAERSRTAVRGELVDVLKLVGHIRCLRVSAAKQRGRRYKPAFGLVRCRVELTADGSRPKIVAEEVAGDEFSSMDEARGVATEVAADEGRFLLPRHARKINDGYLAVDLVDWVEGRR